MSEHRRDIQFYPLEPGASGDTFVGLSPKAERETQVREISPPHPTAGTADRTPRAIDISPARDKAMQTAEPTNISPYAEKTWLTPPMPESFEDFPTPLRTYEQAMQTMRERMERGESVSALDLIATHESYFARELDREEALREMEKLAEKLKRIRERHGDKRMIQALTKLLYSRQYNLRQNTMLGLFTGSERGNCQATAKAASTLLEQVGFDPKTQIAHQIFSDHVRALAKVGESWRVLEGRARPLRTKEIAGTTLVSLEDEKRGLLHLPSSAPIEMGTTVFHQRNGETLNRSLINWLRQGLAKADAWIRRRLPDKTPSIHGYSGTRSASLIGMTSLESLFGSLFPFTPRQTKLIASSLAALSFLYAANRFRDQDVETMEDLSEVIHKDMERVRETANTVVEAIADFAKRELEDVKASVTLEPLPAGSRRKKEDKDKHKFVQTVEGISMKQMDELDRRFAAYYGAAHYLLGGGVYKRSGDFYETGQGYQDFVDVPSEAQTIGKDLYRYFIAETLGQTDQFAHSPLTINFRGAHLNPMRERAKIHDVIAHIGEFQDISSPYPGHLEFRINGEKVGSLGVKGSEQEQTKEQAMETDEVALAEFMSAQMTRTLEDFKETIRSNSWDAPHLTGKVRHLEDVLSYSKTISMELRLQKLDEIVDNYSHLWILYLWYERNYALPDDIEKTRDPSPLFTEIEEARDDLAGLKLIVDVFEEAGLLAPELAETLRWRLEYREPMSYDQYMLSASSKDMEETRNTIEREKMFLRNLLADSNYSWSLAEQTLFRSALGPPDAATLPSPPTLESP